MIRDDLQFLLWVSSWGPYQNTASITLKFLGESWKWRDSPREGFTPASLPLLPFPQLTHQEPSPVSSESVQSCVNHSISCNTLPSLGRGVESHSRSSTLATAAELSGTIFTSTAPHACWLPKGSSVLGELGVWVSPMWTRSLPPSQPDRA